MSFENHFNVFGNLAYEPSISDSANGPVARVVVMEHSSYIDDNGERQQNDVSVPVTLFGGNAEAARDFANKGMQVLISGCSFRNNRWTDKAGTERNELQVVGGRFQLTGNSINAQSILSRNAARAERDLNQRQAPQQRRQPQGRRTASTPNRQQCVYV